MSAVDETVSAPGLKIASAWGVVGISVWVEYAQFVAAALASIYTLILIGEWMWKKFIREFCELRGWVARIRRRKTD